MGLEDLVYEDYPMTLGEAPSGRIVPVSGDLSAVPTDPTVPAGASPSDACPFARPARPVADTSLSCRFLARWAVDLARTRGVQAIAESPLPAEFVEKAPEPDTVQRWYARATSFGIEAAIVHALDAFREAGACDQEPTPEESAFERGARLGMEAVRAAVRAEEARTPRSQCATDPIVDAAVATLDPARLVEGSPLCDGFTAPDSESATYLARAEREYAEGVRSGIAEGANQERGRLVREWVCDPPGGGDGGGGGEGDPLVLDLDGDGIHTMPLSSGAFFDYGDGAGRVHTEWLNWRDGFLVLDRNGDGRVQASELFGDVTVTADGARAADGLLALALYDAPERGGNGDGRIDAQDAVFERLAVWRDGNADAETDAGELQPLSAYGITAIDYRHERFFRADGSEGLATDLWFAYRSRR